MRWSDEIITTSSCPLWLWTTILWSSWPAHFFADLEIFHEASLTLIQFVFLTPLWPFVSYAETLKHHLSQRAGIALIIPLLLMSFHGWRQQEIKRIKYLLSSSRLLLFGGGVRLVRPLNDRDSDVVGDFGCLELCLYEVGTKSPSKYPGKMRKLISRHGVVSILTTSSLLSSPTTQTSPSTSTLSIESPSVTGHFNITSTLSIVSP